MGARSYAGPQAYGCLGPQAVLCSYRCICSCQTPKCSAQSAHHLCQDTRLHRRWTIEQEKSKAPPSMPRTPNGTEESKLIDTLRGTRGNPRATHLTNRDALYSVCLAMSSFVLRCLHLSPPRAQRVTGILAHGIIDKPTLNRWPRTSPTKP